MVARLWSSLTKRTKAKYTKQGVTPQRYNAWNKKTKEQKRALKAKGVDRSGFLGLPPKTPPAPRTLPGIGQVATRATHILLDDGRPAWAATVLRNVLRMNATELRKASTISADQWATLARKQTPENVWFYHK